MLHLTVNSTVHPQFFVMVSVVCIFCRAFGVPEVFKVWDQGSENVGSHQHCKFRDKFPMDSYRILRFSFSRCIVYKDGNLKLSKQLLFCKWDVILL